MAENGEFLDISLPIGYVVSSGEEIKANAYFEDLLFNYLNKTGGESENLIDQSVNITNALPSTVEVKLSAVQKDVIELREQIESVRVPRVENFEDRIEAIEQKNIATAAAQFDNLSKEIEALIQNQPDRTTLPRIEALERQIDELIEIQMQFDSTLCARIVMLQNRLDDLEESPLDKSFISLISGVEESINNLTQLVAQ